MRCMQALFGNVMNLKHGLQSWTFATSPAQTCSRHLAVIPAGDEQHPILDKSLTASVLVSTVDFGSVHRMLSGESGVGQVAIPSAEALLATILGAVHQGAGSPGR